MKNCKVRAYAKINLSLSVVGKRDDGYHLIRSRMQAISLHDDVVVETTDSADGIAVSAAPASDAGYGGHALPQGEDNLAHTAARLSLRLWGGEKASSGDRERGVRITMRKRIPMAAGLAGGSSDAAAVILALARTLAPHARLGEAIKAGALVGADVPFCVAALAKTNPQLGYAGDAEARSSALCEGIGDELSQINPVSGWTIVIKPAIEVSTPVIYADWDDFAAARGQKPIIEEDFSAAREQEPILEGGFSAARKQESILESNDLAPLPGREAASGGNDLAAVAIMRYPLIGDVLQETRSVARAGRVFMTGSGPTIVALYSDEAEASRDHSVLAAKYKDRADIDAVILSKLL
jgi:4-diphosphocytidyl-2-C-methyl-D-erythritol kinase